MSERIEVGDLVMVVRGHSCLVAKIAGIPWIVAGFLSPSGGGWTCSICHMKSACGPEIAATNSGTWRIPVSYLKKIDPPALPESIEHKEEIPA